MQLEEFLKHSHYFSLGHLPTEGFHPETANLSEEVIHDLSKAIPTIQKIDVAAVEKIKSELPHVNDLQHEIHLVMQRGNRIFLSGCGATGRLTLALESTWRKQQQGTPFENSVQALMAGGDFALVKSVENFEDFPEYGEHHLRDLGFKEGDLLIAITEGGETPYVIGTVHAALEASTVNPWFVYCNPKALLCKTVERSREVIENPRVHSLCISIGPMALSGSTRLQAASVQMLAVGAALFTVNPFELSSLLEVYLKEYSKIDLVPFLKPLIEAESSAYLNGNTVLYQTESYPIAVLTDTTERSPTFSLTPFEKSTDRVSPYSLSYLCIPTALTPLESWKKILNRSPLGLEWKELNGKLGLHAILEFNFGTEARAIRATRISPAKQNLLTLEKVVSENKILATFQDENGNVQTKAELHSSLLQNPLLEQIFIKMILNTLSLMVMGRLNRYEGNVMTWVRASNGKLIDRTLRYLEYLIEKRGLKKIPREELIKEIFLLQPILKPDEAMILKILELINLK